MLHFRTSDAKQSTLGLEYVITGRVKTLTDFAIGNKVAELGRNKLLKIGTLPKDVERCEFQQMVKDRYERVDRPCVKTKIAVVGTAGVKTFEGGCRFLRSWYREKFWNWPFPCPDDWPL